MRSGLSKYRPTPAVLPVSTGALLLWGGLFLGLLVVLFGATLWQLAGIWQQDANYSHGFLVLPLSIWMAYAYARKVELPEEGEPTLGLASIAAGALLHLTGVIVSILLLDFFALILILRGFAVTLGGREWARGFMFPILFLFFLFPLPVKWTTEMSVWLQKVVTQLSTSLLDMFFVLHQQGNMIRLLGGDPVYVGQACSGIRQMVAFVALGALVGYWSRRGRIFTLFLIALSLPVAILVNVARVLLMILGTYYFGGGWSTGWMHDIPAFMTLPLGLLLYFGLIQMVNFLGWFEAEEGPA